MWGGEGCDCHMKGFQMVYLNTIITVIYSTLDMMVFSKCENIAY